MKNYMNEWIQEFVSYWKNKQYAPCVGAIAFIISLLVGIIFFLYKVIIFVSFHKVAVLMVLGIASLIHLEIQKLLKKNNKEREENLANARIIEEQEAREMLEENYMIIRTAIFSVLHDRADVFKIHKPDFEDDIDSPRHYIRKNQYIIYSYVFYPLDLSRRKDETARIIQKEIDRRLKNSQFSGLPCDVYLYNGKFYSTYLVDSIEEMQGFNLLNIVITDERYCSYLERKQTTFLLDVSPQIRKMGDDDDDF